MGTEVTSTSAAYIGGGRAERRRRRLAIEDLATGGTGEPEWPGFSQPGPASLQAETPSLEALPSGVNARSSGDRDQGCFSGEEGRGHKWETEGAPGAAKHQRPKGSL